MSSIGRDPVTLFGRRGQAAAETAREFLRRNQVPLRWVDRDLDPLAAFLSDRTPRGARQPTARFPDGVSGAELADGAYRQAQRLGAEFLIGVLVVHARPQADGSIEVEFSSGSTIRARSGLIATGVAYRRLDIPGIEKLIGRGVRYGSPSGAAA